MTHAHERNKLKGQAYVDYAVEVLRRTGARITKPRMAVIESLADSERSVSPADLLHLIHKTRSMPDVDLATVYRTLESLSDNGLVHRVGSSGEFVACGHAACDVDLHLLMHCRSCDKTREVDLPDDIQISVKRYIQRSGRFQMDEHLLQMNGRCNDCVKS